MRKKDAQRGFSLIEVMIGIAIMVIIFAGITNVFRSLMTSQEYTFTQNSNMQDANAVMKLIQREVQKSKEIVQPIKDEEATDFLEYYTEEKNEKGEVRDILNQIFIEGDAVVWQHGETKQLLAIHRVIASEDLTKNSLRFQNISTNSDRSLIEVHVLLKDVEKKNTTEAAAVHLEAQISTR